MSELIDTPKSTQVIYAVFDFLSIHWRRILTLILAVVLLGILTSGIRVIKKEEAGVLTRFGKVVNENVLPGIRYHIPFMETLHVYPVKRIVTVEISSQPQDGSTFTILSGDTNLLEVTLSLQYTVVSLRDFLFAVRHPEAILTMITREELVEEIGSNFIDLIFTSNRNSIEEHLFESVVERLPAHSVGIELTTLTIVNVSPIEETVGAFRDVNDAIAERTQIESEANRKREHLLARSRGQAEAILFDARAKAAARKKQASASASAFRVLLAEYRNDPAQVAITRYWQRMRKTFNEASLAAVNPGNDSAIDINMIDSMMPTPLVGLASVPPGELTAEKPFDIANRTASTAESDPHDSQHPEVSQLTMDGRAHDTSAELDHLSSASPRSLIFDSPSIFAHGHLRRQSQVFSKIDTKPMVEKISSEEGSVGDVEKEEKD